MWKRTAERRLDIVAALHRGHVADLESRIDELRRQRDSALVQLETRQALTHA